jgi:hypothetical protein
MKLLAQILLTYCKNRVMAQAFSLRPQRPGFAPRSVHVGFVVDKWQWCRLLSVFFGFTLSVSFHHGSILIYNLGDEQ